MCCRSVCYIPYDNFCVADDDGGEGNDELRHVGEGAIHQLWDPVPRLLTVEVTHIIRHQLHKECVSTTQQNILSIDHGEYMQLLRKSYGSVIRIATKSMHKIMPIVLGMEVAWVEKGWRTVRYLRV